MQLLPLFKKNVFDVLNLYRTIFPTSDGTRKKGSKPDKLKYRPSNLSYLSFQCEIDTKITINNIFNNEPLYLHFLLKLHQSIYYPDSGNVEALFPPAPIIQNHHISSEKIKLHQNTPIQMQQTISIIYMYNKKQTSVPTTIM